jgi:hypothetical protein
MRGQVILASYTCLSEKIVTLSINRLRSKGQDIDMFTAACSPERIGIPLIKINKE